MSLDLTDRELIEQVRRRDPKSLAVLYDRYARPAYSIAMKILREPDAAEDVAHDAFLIFWQRPELYSPERGTFGPWITRVARNRAIDVVRRRSRNRFENNDEVGIVERLVDPEPEPASRFGLRRRRIRYRLRWMN